MAIAAGTQLGPYEVLAPLGAGGMGEVYRARDPRLGRDVAIKILPSHLLNDAAALERFENETRTVAALNHPNILAIHDIGETDGISYAVMELIEGGTLRARLKEGAMLLPEVLAHARQIAQALVAAHARGIVHGDLKPANVMTARDGRVKLVDFGIATIEPRAENVDLDETRLMESGVILGSPGYMSPEQTRGQRLDARSDLFSFGALLFEMLTGERAFSGKTTADLMSAVLKDQPRKCSEVRQGVSPAFDPLVKRCLEKAPAARFQTAEEVLGALQQVEDQLTGRVVRDPSHGSRGLPSVAVLPFTDMSAEKDQDYFCDGMAEEIITALAKVAGLSVASRTSAFQFKGRSTDIREIGAALGVGHVLEGSVRRAGQRLRVSVQLAKVADGYQLWSERFDRDLSDIFAVQDEIAGTVVRTLEARLADDARKTLVRPPTNDVEAYTLYLQGRHEWNRRTIESMRRGIELFEQALERDPGFAQAHAGLADVYFTLSLYGGEAPHQVMPKAKAAAARALELAPDLADALVSLGSVRSLYDWDWARAEADFQRAITLAPSYATAHQWHAMNVLATHGRFDEALEALDRALLLDPLSRVMHISRARVLHFAGRHPEAVDLLRNTIAFDADFAAAHLFLGDALMEIGNYSAAIEALVTAERLFGSSAEATAARGVALARAGRADEARAVLHALANWSSRGYVSAMLAAQVHAALGDTDAALEALAHAMEQRATNLAWVGVHPAFAPVRNDARFVALLNRMGFTALPADPRPAPR